MTYYVDGADWFNAPTRPDSADWERGLPGIWIERTVVYNQIVEKEIRLEIVGCKFCGSERMAWPEESERINREHQIMHVEALAKVVVAYYPDLRGAVGLVENLIDELVKRPDALD